MTKGHSTDTRGGTKNSFGRLTRPEWLTLFVAAATLFVAAYVPFAVEERSRQVQNQGNCSQALFSLRKQLASYYALDSNADDGTVKESDDSTPPDQKFRNYGLRVDLQSARDSVYAACISICDNEGGDIVDADADPWIDSPNSLTDRWDRNNLDELLRATSNAVDKISKITAGSFYNPINWVDSDTCSR